MASKKRKTTSKKVKGIDLTVTPKLQEAFCKVPGVSSCEEIQCKSEKLAIGISDV